MKDGQIIYIYGQKKEGNRIFVKKSKLKYLFGILAVILLIVVTILLLRWNKFQIKNILINGTDQTDKTFISNKVNDTLKRKYFGVIPGSSVFLFPSDSLRANILASLPSLAKINIETKYPDSLIINAAERKFYAVICGDLVNFELFDSQTEKRTASSTIKTSATSPNIPSTFLQISSSTPENASFSAKCFYMDDTGFIYSSAPNILGSLVLKISTDFDLTLPQQVFKQSDMEDMASIALLSRQYLNMDVLEFYFSKEVSPEVHVRLSGGFQIFMNKNDDYKKDLTNLEAALRGEIKDKAANLKYVDLRFGNKVFYKYK